MTTTPAETPIPSALPTSLWRTVLMLALPVAAQMLLQSFLGMADVLMVGSLGAEAVAAVGLAAKLHFLMLVTMLGVATACAIMVAQYTGARDFAGCQRTLAMALIVGALFMVPFTLLFFFSHVWVGWVNPDPAVAELTATFLLITAPVLILAQQISIYEAALRAIGNTMVPLLMGALGVLLNILFNYILIFGHLGFPALGVAGAAWGTLLARILQLAATLLWLYGVRHGFALRLADFVRGVSLRIFKRFLRFAFPLLVNHAMWAVGNATYHVATGFAGTHALAVMGVMVPIESTFFALFVGLANASSVLVGRALGAGDNDGAWRLARFFNRLVISLVLSLSLLLWLCRDWILTAFAHVGETTITLLAQVILVFCLGVWVKVINMIRILGVLRAGGDINYCLIVDFVVMWVFGVPIFIAAVWYGQFPFVVLFALMFVEDALKWLPIRWRVRSGVWQNNLTRGDD